MSQVQHSENRPLLSEAFIILSLGFSGSLVICQVLASKVGMVILPGIGTLIFPAGIVAYATTFAFTDAIEEVWGKRVAQRVVRSGFWVNLLI
ncbi:MAG: VUT family protein, partial [bacterium]